mgnify:CR=1 FL=1
MANRVVVFSSLKTVLLHRYHYKRTTTDTSENSQFCENNHAPSNRIKSPSFLTYDIELLY